MAFQWNHTTNTYAYAEMCRYIEKIEIHFYLAYADGNSSLVNFIMNYFIT